MPIIQIDNLGSPGIIKDIPAYELPIQAFSHGKNVRFVEGGVERVLGFTPRLESMTYPPYWVMPWDNGTVQQWVVGCQTTLMLVSNAWAESDVSGSAYSAGTYPRWQGNVFNGVPIANNRALVDHPQSWDGSSEFEDLPNWPASSPDWYARVIRPYKNFLIALYLKEDSTTYPTRIRWSDAADAGAVPSTWVPASNNLAGVYSLSETTAPVVDCLSLGDYNVVYKEDSTHLMALVNSTFVFQFRQAFSELGLLSENCVRSFFRKHFVVGFGDVVVHNGVEATSVISSAWRKELFNTISSDFYRRTFVREFPLQREMWICFVPDGALGSPRAALIWNWDTNSWSYREFEGYSAETGVAYIGLGIQDTSNFSRIVDNQTTIIVDDDTSIVDHRAYNPTREGLLMACPSRSELHVCEEGYDFDGDEYSSYVARLGLAFSPSPNGGATVNTQSIKFCQAVYPKITADQGVTIDIYVGASEYIDGPITWTGPFEFDPHTMQKVDCQVSGRALAIQFITNSGGKWRMHSYGLDVTEVGGQ